MPNGPLGDFFHGGGYVGGNAIEKDGKTFVHLRVDVHGCPEWVWCALEHDWKMTRQRTPKSKAEAHDFIREWFMRRYHSEYWFDVTKLPEHFVEKADIKNDHHAKRRR